MPTIMVNIPSTTADALTGLKFKTQGFPALVSLYASTETAGDVIGFSVGSTEFLSNAEVNIESATDVVDVDRDQVLFQEAVPAGEYFLPATVTTDTKVILVIEPITP